MKNIQWRNLALNALSRTSSTTGIEREFQFLLTLSWSDLLIILSSSPSISSCSLFFAAACLFCRRLSFLTSLLNCLWLKICPGMWIYKLIVHNIYYKKIEEFLFSKRIPRLDMISVCLGPADPDRSAMFCFVVLWKSNVHDTNNLKTTKTISTEGTWRFNLLEAGLYLSLRGASALLESLVTSSSLLSPSSAAMLVRNQFPTLVSHCSCLVVV